MTFFRPMMLAGLCLVSAQAFAQWQWIGSDGRKVYSDRPPPSDIPAQNVLKQPGGAAPLTSGKTAPANRPTPTGMPTSVPNGSPAAPAANAPLYGDIKPPESKAADAKAAASAAAPASAASKPADKAAEQKAKEAEQKAKQAEAAEAAKRKEIEAKNAAVQADNCRRANEAKATLNSGMRIARVNDKGERIVLDDKARADEIKRADDIIASACKN